MARHGEGVHACGLGVEATTWLGVPILHGQHRVGRVGLRVDHGAQATHGLVGELAHLGRLADPAPDGTHQDAKHHCSLHLEQDEEAHDSEEEDAKPCSSEVIHSEGDEVHQDSRMIPHNVNAVAGLQANESQKQADSCHCSLHHPCWKELEDESPCVGRRHHNEDGSLNKHCEHDLLHRIGGALEANDGVRKVGIHAHAWPQAKGQVGPQCHHQRGNTA
mmetsp:Transcript_19295/g.44874  ORF Transcript_19295/g.44874 Transcript_19295/m.44874 type:complete len:219 (-) Transcript_19295:326-982(-)